MALRAQNGERIFEVGDASAAFEGGTEILDEIRSPFGLTEDCVLAGPTVLAEELAEEGR